jgi:hypothetical protein
MIDDQVWKQRFLIFTAIRVTGLIFFGLGLAIAFTDFLRPGGWPLIGAILIICGAIDAVVAPRLLRRSWERADR